MKDEPHIAQLGFGLITPIQALRPYISSYWHIRCRMPLLAYQEEYMHPRGGFGLVFNFGDQVQLDGQPISEPLFLDGTTTISRKMGFSGCLDLLGVRFREGGAYPILGIPLVELRNEIALLHALDRRPLLELHAKLNELQALQARIELLEAWLLRQLSFGKEQNKLTPLSLQLLQMQAADQPIGQLIAELAISQRQLERVYQREVGMTPKQYTQLLRVERARLALKQIEQGTLSHLAAELGFYDQPHFIREFSAVVGMTPYAYMKRSRKR